MESAKSKLKEWYNKKFCLDEFMDKTVREIFRDYNDLNETEFWDMVYGEDDGGYDYCCTESMYKYYMYLQNGGELIETASKKTIAGVNLKEDFHSDIYFSINITDCDEDVDFRKVLQDQFPAAIEDADAEQFIGVAPGSEVLEILGFYIQGLGKPDIVVTLEATGSMPTSNYFLRGYLLNNDYVDYFEDVRQFIETVSEETEAPVTESKKPAKKPLKEGMGGCFYIIHENPIGYKGRQGWIDDYSELTSDIGSAEQYDTLQEAVDMLYAIEDYVENFNDNEGIRATIQCVNPDADQIIEDMAVVDIQKRQGVVDCELVSGEQNLINCCYGVEDSEPSMGYNL